MEWLHKEWKPMTHTAASVSPSSPKVRVLTWKRLPSLLWMRMWKKDIVSDPTSALPLWHSILHLINVCHCLFMYVRYIRSPRLRAVGSAVPFFFFSQHVRWRTTASEKPVQHKQGGTREGPVTKPSVKNRIYIRGAWYAIMCWSCRLECRQHGTCSVKNAPYGLVWPLCSGWK